MTTLSDVDIQSGMDNNLLIRNGEPAQIGPACYELRMGSVYYDLTEGDRRIDVGTAGNAIIKPGHRVVLITFEELVVPPNMIARVTSKGSLFSIGLSAVSTYADPGFSGNIGIVTQNMSEKYIVIPKGESIAKVDFSYLSCDVKKPYRGQHGYQTQIWPIRHHLQKTHDEVKRDPRVGSEESESYQILPPATARILRHIRQKQRVVDVAIFIAVLVNGALLASVSTQFFDTTIAIAGNLVSACIVGVAMWFSRVKE